MTTTADIYTYTRERAHEPGNATRYELLLVPDRGTLFTFAWLNAPGHGRACTLNQNGYLTLGYLSEKLGYDNDADLWALLGWLNANGFDGQTPFDNISAE